MHPPLHFLFRRVAALLAVSTLALTAGGALAANISGSLPNYKDSGITFNYVEQKSGGSGPGARGIRIYIAGGRDQSYKFSPNPHDDPWYNKNQAKFYRQAAEALADAYLAKKPNPAFPRYDFKSMINGIEYSYNQP